MKYRVDVFCSGGWQHLASFVQETAAFEWAQLHLAARVWNDDDCFAFTEGPRSWRAPEHARDCDGKPCECGEVPLLGSMKQWR